MVLIEMNTLSSKTKAFLIMALDLYYSNFTNVGTALEKLYQTFLVDEKKTEEPVTKSDKGHQGKTTKNNENEDRKLQSSPERTINSKKDDKPDAKASTAKPSVSETKSTPTSSNSTSDEETKSNNESSPTIEQSPASEPSIKIES